MGRDASGSLEAGDVAALVAELRRADCFHLEVDGISEAGFVRCSGLGARREVFACYEGGAEAPRVLRGRVAYETIVLERGVAKDTTLYEWFLRGDRRDGAIVLVATSGEELARWRFVRGWPCAWRGPRLDASRAEVAVEALEIVHEGIACETA